MSNKIVFDIGGTRMRVGISADGKTLSRTKVEDTPKDFDEGISLIKKISKELLQETTNENSDNSDAILKSGAIAGVSGGIAAILDTDRTNVFRSPHLHGWEGKPLQQALTDIFGVEVKLENDAALAGLGEAKFGAGKAYEIVMYMTVSTGVGGARIVDGKIDKKVFDFEPGFQIINGSSLEDLISGSAIEKRFGKKAYELNSLEYEALWGELALHLAQGIYNSLMYWSPDVVVLGGSMILGSPSISLEKVEKRLKELNTVFPNLPVIKKSDLGDESGLYGALIF